MTKTAVTVGLLGASRGHVRRVADALVATGDFRAFDLERPVRDALEVLDPMISTDRSLRGLVSDFGWEGALAHRVHGPEVARLLACMRTELPGRSLPTSLWVSATRAAIAASDSMLGPSHVLVHGVTTDDEASWLRSQGACLWQVCTEAYEPHDPRADRTVEAGSEVSDTALGRRLERELARLARPLVTTAPREDA